MCMNIKLPAELCGCAIEKKNEPYRDAIVKHKFRFFKHHKKFSQFIFLFYMLNYVKRTFCTMCIFPVKIVEMPYNTGVFCM